MRGRIDINGQQYDVNLSKGHDISLGISPERSTSCFGASPPDYRPMSGESWTARVSEGGSVNAYEVWFNPHAHGTHTECLGHISKEHHHLDDQDVGSLFVARLVTINPTQSGENRVITREAIIRALELMGEEEGLIIRTEPNSEAKAGKDYTGTNPPYLEEEAAQSLMEAGIMHLLIDLPSVDPESDGGALRAHKAFWNWPTFEGRQRATITELVYVPNEVRDGIYLLNLQRASFHLDCAPSRPVLFPIIERKTTK